MSLRTSALSLLLLSAPGLSSQAAIITFHDDAVYNADVNVMNASLGIDGSFAVEDFEDGTLISGLTISDNFDATGTFTAGANTQRNDANLAWDGTHTFYAHPAYAVAYPLFSFDSAISAFGVSLSGYQPGFYGPTELFINGVSQGDIVMDDHGASARTGYLFIQAEAGDNITSIGFTHGGAEGIAYDHLAVNYGATASVPTPTPLILFALTAPALLRLRTTNQRLITSKIP